MSISEIRGGELPPETVQADETAEKEGSDFSALVRARLYGEAMAASSRLRGMERLDGSTLVVKGRALSEEYGNLSFLKVEPATPFGKTSFIEGALAAPNGLVDSRNRCSLRPGDPFYPVGKSLSGAPLSSSAESPIMRAQIVAEHAVEAAPLDGSHLSSLATGLELAIKPHSLTPMKRSSFAKMSMLLPDTESRSLWDMPIGSVAATSSCSKEIPKQEKAVVIEIDKPVSIGWITTFFPDVKQNLPQVTLRDETGRKWQVGEDGNLFYLLRHFAQTHDSVAFCIRETLDGACKKIPLDPKVGRRIITFLREHPNPRTWFCEHLSLAALGVFEGKKCRVFTKDSSMGSLRSSSEKAAAIKVSVALRVSDAPKTKCDLSHPDKRILYSMKEGPVVVPFSRETVKPGDDVRIDPNNNQKDHSGVYLGDDFILNKSGNEPIINIHSIEPLISDKRHTLNVISSLDEVHIPLDPPSTSTLLD